MPVVKSVKKVQQTSHEGFMTDVIKKKSRLELDKEKSKKRPFSEISGFEDSNKDT